MTALYPGSFDPITNGHMDIIDRCLKVFDQVVILIAVSFQKAPLFSEGERKRMILEIYKNNPKISVESYEGLLMDYARKKKNPIVIRGLRAISDFEYEFQMTAMNKKLNTDVETLFMMTTTQYSFLSSSIIKEVARLGGDVKGLVPPNIEQRLREKFSQ